MEATNVRERLKIYAMAIVRAREFCGDERAALREAEAEHGALSGPERIVVRKMAEGIWYRFQMDAGVTAPIGAEERKEITRIMERG